MFAVTLTSNHPLAPTSGRIHMNRLLLAALLSLPVVACGSSEDPADAPAMDAVQTVTLDEAEREVRCGCKIEGIGHCGNYVADGDDWLEIANPDDFGLGVMEWCRVPADEHPMAVTAGERRGDRVTLSMLRTR